MITQGEYQYESYDAHVTPSGTHRNTLRFVHPDNGYTVDYTSTVKTTSPILTLHSHPHIKDYVVVHPMSEEIANTVEHESIDSEKEYGSSMEHDHHLGIVFSHDEAAIEFEQFMQKIVSNADHLEDESLPWPLFVHPSTGDFFAFTGDEEDISNSDHQTDLQNHFIISHSHSVVSNGEEITGNTDAIQIPPMIRLDQHGGLIRDGNLIHMKNLKAHAYGNIVRNTQLNFAADPPRKGKTGSTTNTFTRDASEDELLFADRDDLGDDDIIEEDMESGVSLQGLDPTGVGGKITQTYYWTVDKQFGLFLNYDKKADYAPPIDLLSKAPEWLTSLGGGGTLILQLIETYAVARAGIRLQLDANITGVSYFKGEIIGDLGAGVGYLFEVVFDTDELNPWISVGGTIVPKFRVLTFTIPAGPIIIPVSFDMGLGAGAGVSMRGGFRHTAAAVAGLSVRYGVEYTKANGFQKIDTYSPPSLTMDAGEPDFYFDYLDLDLLANITLVPKIFGLGPDLVSMWDLKMRFTAGGDQCTSNSLSYKTYLIGDLSIEIPFISIPFLSGKVDLGDFLPLPWYIYTKLYMTQLTCPICGGCLGLQDLFNAFKSTTPVVSERPEFVSLSGFEAAMPDGTLFDSVLDPYVKADLVCVMKVDGDSSKTINRTMQSAMTVTKEDDAYPMFDDVLTFELPQDYDLYTDCYIDITLYDDGSDNVYLTGKVIFSTCTDDTFRCTKAWSDQVLNSALSFNVDYWPEIEASAWSDSLNFVPAVPRFYRIEIPEGTSTMAFVGSRYVEDDGESNDDINFGGDTSELEDEYAGSSTSSSSSNGQQAKMIFTAVPGGCGAPSTATSVLPRLDDDTLTTPVLTLPADGYGDMVELWISKVKIKKSAFLSSTVKPQIKTRITYLNGDEEVVTPFPNIQDEDGNDIFPPSIDPDTWFEYYGACPDNDVVICQPNSIKWSFPQAAFDSMEFDVYNNKNLVQTFRFVANDNIDYSKLDEIVTVTTEDDDTFYSVDGTVGDSQIVVQFRVKRATEYVIGATLASTENEADIRIMGMPSRIPKYANIGTLGSSVPSLAFGLPVYSEPTNYDVINPTLESVVNRVHLGSTEIAEKMIEISNHSLLDLDALRELDDMYLERYYKKKHGIHCLSEEDEYSMSVFNQAEEEEEEEEEYVEEEEDDNETIEIPTALSGQNLIASTADQPDLSTVSTPMNTGNGAMVFLDPYDYDNQTVSMILELANDTSGWVEVQTLHPEGQPFPAIGDRPGLAITTNQARPIIGAVVKKLKEEEANDSDEDESDDYLDQDETLAELGAGTLSARMWLRVYSEKAFKGRLFMLPYTLAEPGKAIGLVVGDSGQHVIEVQTELPFDAFYVERDADIAKDDHEFSLAFTASDGDMFSSVNRVSVTFTKGMVRTENPYAVSTLRTLLLAEQGTVTGSIYVVPYGLFTASSQGSTKIPYDGGKFMLSVESILYNREARQRYLLVRSEAPCSYLLEDANGTDITPRDVDEDGNEINPDEPLDFSEDTWLDWHDTGIWPSDGGDIDPDDDNTLDTTTVTFSQLIPFGNSEEVASVMNYESATTNLDADEYGITSASVEFFMVDVVTDFEIEPIEGEHWSTGGDTHLVFEKVPITLNEDNATRLVLEITVDENDLGVSGSAMVHYDTNSFLSDLPFGLLDPAEDRQTKTPKTLSSTESSNYKRQIVVLKYLVDRVRQGSYLADDSTLNVNVGIKTRSPTYFNMRLRHEPEDLTIKITQSSTQADNNQFTMLIPDEVAVAFEPAAFLSPETLSDLGKALRYKGYDKVQTSATQAIKTWFVKLLSDTEGEEEEEEEEEQYVPSNTDTQLAALEKAFRASGFDVGLQAKFDDYLTEVNVTVPVKYADSSFSKTVDVTFEGLPVDFTSSNTTIAISGSFQVTPEGAHGLLFYIGIGVLSIGLVVGLVFGGLYLYRRLKATRSGETYGQI